MKICTIIGARPQFIKAAMVSRAIGEYNKCAGYTLIEERILHTGQHYDHNMSDFFFQELNIPEPSLNLGVGSGNHGEITGKMMTAIEIELMNNRPDWILVYGDTNSTLAGALAAAKLHIPIAHVEAGLRSFNKKMPEEINRIITDHISDLLFCPTDTAVYNLKKEGIDRGVYKVGDVMYDAAIVFKDVAERSSTVLDRYNLKYKEYALATLHRAENTDNDLRLSNIMAGLNSIGKNHFPVVMPLHPRTQKALDRIGFKNSKNKTKKHIIFLTPLSFLDMIMLEKNANLILTDSGGIQKEAYFHRVPCITLREETEWTETVESGWNQLAGANADVIAEAFYSANKGNELKIFGDGNASKKIIELLMTSFVSKIAVSESYKSNTH